jgi:hypothetical protein
MISKNFNWTELDSMKALCRGGSVVAVVLALSACGGRTQQEVGGKTSWLASCSRDADCSALEGAVCVQHLCTLTCEDDECENIAGTRCVESSPNCLTRSTCLPDCKDDSECRRFGSDYTCHASVCVANSCSSLGGNGETPDGSTPTGPSSETDTAVTQPDGSVTLPAPTDSAARPSSTNPDETTTPAASAPVTTIDEGSSGAQIVCTISLEALPEQRPYAYLLDESGVNYAGGEPGCNGGCGYEYSAWDEVWELNPTLQCPLETSTCEELAAPLEANPARCNTAADCTSVTSRLAPCDPYFEQPEYFDSALFTPEERAAREAVLLALQQHGCRRPALWWDGPIYELGCVDNLCALVDTGHFCGEAPPECDACAPELDAGLRP